MNEEDVILREIENKIPEFFEKYKVCETVTIHSIEEIEVF